MLSFRRAVGVTALAAVGIAAGCQWIVGIGGRHLSDAGIGSPCESPNLPGAPAQSTSSSTDSKSFLLALQQVQLGQTDGGPYYGFNLDKTCTCLGTPPGASSCNGTDLCDDDGGIDNYARHIFEQVNELQEGGVITTDKLNFAISSGLSGALIQVQQWNGTPNDAQVHVVVYGSVGFVGYDAGKAPAFEGGDSWYVDPTSAGGKHFTDNAYVSNGTLVATSLDFPIVIGSAFTQPVYIELHSGIIAAQIMTDTSGNVTNVTGQLGGRWLPSDFLPSLATVPDPLQPSLYLCPNDAGQATQSITYGLIKTIICANLDINQDPASDGTGSCNAVSMGLYFMATPANLGPTAGFPDSGSPCQGNTDNCP